jgi:hypothetical protein
MTDSRLNSLTVVPKQLVTPQVHRLQVGEAVLWADQGPNLPGFVA